MSPKIEELLNIYIDILQNSDNCHKHWSELFGNIDRPIKLEYYECSESMIEIIDWKKVNKMVRAEIIKLLAGRLDEID